MIRYDMDYRTDEPDPNWNWLYLPTSEAYDTLFGPFLGQDLLKLLDPIWIPQNTT